MIHKLLFPILASLISAGAFAASPALQTPGCGRIDRLVINSPELQQDVYVDILVPDDYDASASRRYPVVYMHDGQNLFDASTTWNHQSWEMDSIVCSLEASGEKVLPIIVGIHSDNSTRVADLMPQKGVSPENLKRMLTLRGYEGVPIRGDAYARFMVNTLKPEIDLLYNTLPDRENTGVMGSSMGGLMSIYSLCEYPDVFGTAMCLSTHWIGKDGIEDSFAGDLYEYLDDNLPSASDHRIYVDRGTETLDAFYGEKDEMMKKLMRGKGYDDRKGNFMSMVDAGGTHEERSWARRAAIPLRFFLSGRAHAE